MLKKAQVFTAVSMGAFLFTDRIFKWLALNFWGTDLRPVWWFGWRPFLNPGVAFGIPVPRMLTIFLTAIILVLIGYKMYLWTRDRGSKNYELRIMGATLILFGAISNLFDRIVYNATIDYLQIITGVFNLADFMIMGGFVILIWDFKKAE